MRFPLNSVYVWRTAFTPTGDVMRYAMGLLTISLLLAACGKAPEDSTPPKPQQGRAETQGIRRTDSIGYAGGAIANKVDGVLNENEQQKSRMDQRMEAQEAMP